MIICLDPGHSGPHDPGAVHTDTGHTEAAAVLDIAMAVKKSLEYVGCIVLLTRSGNIDTDDLDFRCRMANNANADLFVSIHANSFGLDSANGTETYCYTSSDDGRLLARYIQQSIISHIGTRDRGVKESDYYVLRHTTMPAALVECGFISNDADRAKCFSTEAVRRRMGRTIANGIMDYILRHEQ